MICVRTLARFTALSVVLVLMGCAEPTSADIAAPDANTAPATSCTTRATAGFPAAKCAPIN